MSTRTTTPPIDAAAIRDTLQRALAAGVTPAEIDALILRAFEGDPAHCPDCDGELVTFAIDTLRCTSRGIRVATAAKGTR